VARTSRTVTSDTVESEARATENRVVETPTAKATNITTTTSNNGVKSLFDHVEQIKDSLKAVIWDLATVIDMVKTADPYNN
jgi:hypothetical protein